MKKLLEYQVTVIRINGRQETGILIDCDEQWIKVGKDDESLLYIPIHAIRLVKILTPSAWPDSTPGQTGAMELSKTLLTELLECPIEIKSGLMQQEFADVGILEECDCDWIKLHKATGQLLCFPLVSVSNVRQIIRA